MIGGDLMSRIVELINDEGEVLSPLTSADIVTFASGKTVEQMMSEEKTEMYTPTVECSHAMFKVGQGDTVDYSDNVVSGAYESMVLKGKSMVNCIQEPSSQDVVLPYEFEEGRYVTINDTKESGALGVELKGQTLVNIHDKKTPTLAAAENDWYSNLVIETNSISFTVAKLPENWRYISFKSLNLSMLKPNTKYLVAFEEASGVSTVTFKNGDSTHPLSDTVQIVSNKAIVTTTSDWVNSAQILYIYVPARNVGAEVKVKNPMIIEYVEGMENWDIPYFEGMASCKMPILKTIGKNLFNENEKIEAFIESNSTQEQLNLGVKNTWTTPWIKAKTNTSYTMQGGNRNRWQIKSRNNVITFMDKKTITTLSDTEYIRCYYCNETYTASNVQLEESSSATSYEPYKSSSLSLPEEVVLRSLPNGVRDTFNTRTGVYTQRIGEAIVNGSEDWKLNNTEGTTTQRFFCSMLANSAVDNNTKGTQQYLCDRLRTITWSQTCELGLTINGSGVFVYNNSIEYTVGSVKQWLSQNPVKLQYELATPIVTKINLSSTLKSWNTTTHIYSEIPENTLYPILSHSNPSYPVILKPSTKYSIVANSYSNSHTNSAINFNLGGATTSTTVGNRVTTITTPSTLSNELLTMSGRGNRLNNVMVIEGDVVGDEPYFEGICDCQSPILSNVGKNLFNINGEWHKSTYSYSVPALHNGSQTMLVLEDGVQITTNNNQYHAAFGQFINIRGINNLRISFIGEYTDTKTVPEIVVQLLHKNEELPKTMSNTLASTDYNHRKTSFKLSQSGETVSKTINTQGYECAYVHVCGNYLSSMSGTYTFIARNICVEDADRANVCEPYKSNILSAVNKNIFDGEWEDGAYDSNGVEAACTTTSRNKNKHIKVEPSCTIITTYPCVIHEYDVNKQFIQYTYNVQKLTLSDRTQYINFRTLNDKTCNSVEYQNFSMQVVDKTIVLRSLPNGVCDTLNVETGEYVQRIGEVVFNGSESWSVNNSFDTKTTKFFFISNPNLPEGVRGISTLVSHYASSNYFSRANANYRADAKLKELECVMGGDGATGMIQFYIKQSRLSSPDLTGFKQWLSQNPTTVQYVLETPIVKTVDLSGYPFAYKNGHVILSSGAIEQSLTPKVEYALPISRTGQIEQNTKQVIRHDQVINDLESRLLSQLVDSRYKLSLLELDYELSLF